jgi:hypothetical protein
VFTIKQQNKEVIEIPVPSLAKIEKEKKPPGLSLI